jgi:flagellar basal body rod protein FlgB
VEVVAESGLYNGSKGIDPGTMVGSNTVDLDDQRCTLGKESRFYEVMLEQKSQSSKGRSQ